VARADARRAVPQRLLRVLLARGARAAVPRVRPVARRAVQVAKVLVQRAAGDPLQAAQVVQLRGQGGRVQVVRGQGDDGHHHLRGPGPRHGRVRQHVPVSQQKHIGAVLTIVQRHRQGIGIIPGPFAGESFRPSIIILLCCC